MPGPFHYSSQSLKQRATLDIRLQEVFDIVLEHFDFSITEGFRNEHDQNVAFATGKSQKRWPFGEHNQKPSKAADAYPWPLDWSDDAKNIQRMCLFAGMVLAVGWSLGYNIRWGGDWNRNGDTRDEKFRDYGHFEILD